MLKYMFIHHLKYKYFFLLQNGHVTSAADVMPFSTYSSNRAQHQLQVESAFPLVASSSSGFPQASTSTTTLSNAARHLASLYPDYTDYDSQTIMRQDTPDNKNTHHSRVGEGIKLNGLSETRLQNSGGFSPSFTNGFSHNNFKSPTTTLPLSLQLSSGRSTTSVGIPTTCTSTTIPRLGIPVDPSQYIVPPRTQVMQGSLATHV